MLVQLALGSPQDIVSDYGYTYEEIKNQPHFIAQYQKVESELFQEGAITKVIAGAGLHKVVEAVAIRILDPRMPTADLLKSGEFLKRVKDEGADKNRGADKPQFSIEINFPDGTRTTIMHAPVEKEVDLLELEADDEIPTAIIEAYNEDHFGVDIN